MPSLSAEPPLGTFRAVVLGGSAGSLEPLLGALAGLPPGYPIPLAVVVHQPRRRPSSLAAVLAQGCGLPVYEAQDKQPMAAPGVYLAPPDYHLLVERGPACALSVDEPVRFSVPSIDVLFESAAASLGPQVAAVLLSGANEDGGEGLSDVCGAGGLALVQEPATATVPTMPEAGLASCPAARALTPLQIRRLLQHLPGAASARPSP